MAEKKAPTPADPSAAPDETAEDMALRLVVENDELRGKVADLEAVLAEKVAGAVAAALAEPTRPRFLLSEGVRVDLEMHGEATDPATGNKLELDRETGAVVMTTREAGGKVTTANVATLNVPRQR